MTYARARLWLGISGVGSLVVLASLALFYNLPISRLAANDQFSWNDVGQIIVVAFAVNLWMTPFDFLGGYLLPNRFNKSSETFSKWGLRYIAAVIGQSILFVAFAVAILTAGRFMGLTGAILAICGGISISLFIRAKFVQLKQIEPTGTSETLAGVQELIQAWDVSLPATIIVRHRDIGFTGGIIGFGSNARVVVPEAWLHSMSPPQLATAIARRAVAISSGSYTRGMILAFLWNTIGFALCCCLPSAGVTTVAALMTTFCWFTLWSFLGLLVLPTASRNASLEIDQILSQQGAPPDLILETASSQDDMQDGEPDRSKWIETIFHPVPSVSSRNQKTTTSTFSAFNAARTTLFFSWACFGVLSRAVHCNVGRPELWVMLPTD